MKISADNGHEPEILDIGATLSRVGSESIKLENHGGRIRIRTACDSQLELSIKHHSEMLLTIATPVDVTPAANVVKPEPPAAQPTADVVTSSPTTDVTTPEPVDANGLTVADHEEIYQAEKLTAEECQLADNRRAAYGIREVMNVVLDLNDDFVTEQMLKLERAAHRSDRWAIITEVFRKFRDDCQSETPPLLPLDEVPF